MLNLVKNYSNIKSRWCIAVFFLIYSLFAHNSSFAMEFAYESFEGTKVDGTAGVGNYLHMRGEIVPGDYKKFLNLVIAEPFKYLESRIFLDSPGGNVSESIKIAMLIKRTFVPVFVTRGKCASSCFLIFASAATRDASRNAVGIHRPYLSHSLMKKLAPSEAEKEQNKAIQMARDYLLELQLPMSIIDMMVRRSSTDIYWLTRDDLDNLLGNTAPWYEEFLTAKCGWTKQLQNRFDDPSLSDSEFNQVAHELGSIRACGRMETYKESLEFIKTETGGLRK